MSYFHATAVFEARGTSLEEADRIAASLFKSLRHNRIHYYEHDVTACSGPYPSSKSLYFSIIAEFDVDAYNEDRAGELTDEILETLATDDVQFIAFGLTPGEQRIQPVERAPQVEPELEKPQEAGAETGEAEERKGKKRSSRGRGRKRKDDRETDGGREAQAEDSTETVAGGDVAVEPTVEREERPASELFAPIVVTPEAEQKPALDIRPLVQEEELPATPPPRSSAAMQITLSMSFRASEFGLPTPDLGALDQEAFLARATVEARSRHPELPLDVVPIHEISPLPWGEVVLRLTWQYPVPVPSATEEA